RGRAPTLPPVAPPALREVARTRPGSAAGRDDRPTRGGGDRLLPDRSVPLVSSLVRANARSTKIGSYVREEMHHVRGGKHGARSAKQAIAVGLSKARRAGAPGVCGESGYPLTTGRWRAGAPSRRSASGRPASHRPCARPSAVAAPPHT